MKALFISREDLIRYTPVSGNLDFDRVIQYIEIAQDIHVQGLLGGNLYTKLQNDVINGTLSGQYETLVKNHVKPLLCHYAFLEFLPFAQFTVGNKGVFKHTSESAETLNSSDISMMTETTRDTAQHYATRMVDYLCNYPTDFPEYLVNTKEQMNPNKNTIFGGWNI